MNTGVVLFLSHAELVSNSLGGGQAEIKLDTFFAFTSISCYPSSIIYISIDR